MTESTPQAQPLPCKTGPARLVEGLPGILLAIHRRLLPNRREIGWIPYLWLFYLSLPVWRWIIQPTSTTVLWLGSLSLLVFFGVYFNGYWRRGLAVLPNIAALVALGVAWTPFSSAGIVFYVYGSGFAGEVGPPKIGRRVLAAIAITVILANRLTGQHLFHGLLTLCLCGVVGATNIYFSEISRKGDALRRSQEEVERLATIAERERIARDLHDLLGHTLSVITLKAELARKLSERGDERAATEIADVERISRDALRQVREAVEGFREAGLAGELARARLVCEARDITLDTEVGRVELATRQESALAMVLREAVTNLARHSNANRCRITLKREPSEIVLSIHDNGQLARPNRVTESAGHGLLGMRERLGELNGRLLVDPSDGWLLEARLPAPALVPIDQPDEEISAQTLPTSPELAVGDVSS